MATTAARLNGGYRLHGQKTWVSNGGVASYYVVFATVDPGSGHKGITAFVVEKDDEGVTFGQPMRKMGQRAILNTEIFLEDALLSEDRATRRRGAGLLRAHAHLRPLAGHPRRRRDRTRPGRDRVRARVREGAQVQFGKPIAEHQAVAFRLADMATKIEASRLLVWKAARKLDVGEPAPLEAAMAKLHASRRRCSAPGRPFRPSAAGATRASTSEKWMRDAKLEEIEEGTSDIQRLIISRQLLRDSQAPDPATRGARSRDLRPLFEPESVAILSASNDPAKWVTGSLEVRARRHRRKVTS